MKIRILVVEDNEVFRLGTTSLIGTQADMEIVGEACNGAEAVTMFPVVKPDVVVLDLRMPHLDGVQVTRSLCALAPPARVLILTHYQGEEDIAQTLRAGALGYLSKDSPGEDVLAAIRIVATGKHHLTAPMAILLAENAARSPLSARQRQVLLCVFNGLSNREIARALGIAERSATTYVSQILTKLNAKSRTEAVAIALRRGLLQPRPMS